MKTKFIKSIFTLALAIVGFSFLPATPTFADSVCDRDVPPAVKDAAGCNTTESTKVENAIVAIINSIIAVLGLVAVAFIIYGGVQYMTSSGDSGKAKKARDTILYACVGLVVAALAFAITNFTISAINKSATEADTEKPTTESETPLP